MALTQVQLPSSCIFSYTTAHVTSLSTQKRILCEWHLAEYSTYGRSQSASHVRELITCDNMRLDHSFLFTVITDIVKVSNSSV